MDTNQTDNDNDSYNAPSESRWTEFLNNTTLHGVRNVVSSRKIFIRITWLIFLLAAGTYYLATVYNAIDKYLQHPVTTKITMTYKTNIVFPTVTICPNNIFSKAKVMAWDENPAFSAQGLNLSVCEVTRNVRESKMNNLTCGLAMICCCVYLGFPLKAGDIDNCTDERREILRYTLQQSGVNFNMEDFLLYYSPDKTDLFGTEMCRFSWNSSCETDFSRNLATHGLCYTFNSGEDEKMVRNVSLAGLNGGLSLILNANYSDETIGKLSRGFKVLIHKPGEYFDDWDGINLSPGTHASITVSEQRVSFQCIWSLLNLVFVG
ncbi:bile acid-sensitive ion channel-like [Oculina patagonica]